MKQELIDRAAAECRAAFAAAPNAKWAWCCHHGILYEELTEPPENRIAFSLANKEIGELVTRLVNFRPVLNDAKLKPLNDDYYVKRKLLNDDFNAKLKPLQQPLINLYRQEVPNGTWNDTSIF